MWRRLRHSRRDPEWDRGERSVRAGNTAVALPVTRNSGGFGYRHLALDHDLGVALIERSMAEK
jgi:hypothetical protein